MLTKELVGFFLDRRARRGPTGRRGGGGGKIFQQEGGREAEGVSWGRAEATAGAGEIEDKGRGIPTGGGEKA